MKIIEAKRKIDSSFKGNSDEHVRSLLSTGPSNHITVNRLRLPKLTLAKFKRNVTTCEFILGFIQGSGAREC